MAKKRKTAGRKKKAVKKKKVVKKKKTVKKKKVVKKKKKVVKKKKAVKKKKVVKKKKKVVKKKKAGKKKKRKPNAAFMKEHPVTPALQAIVKSSTVSRPQAMKKIWAYIRKHGLQDKRNRRQINLDSALGKLFPGKKSVIMFELPKGVSRNLKD